MNKIEQSLSKYKHGSNIHKRRKQQKHKLHKLALNLSRRLDLRSSNKHFTLQNLFIYYTWKNIRKQCMSNKLEIIAPTWNYEFELPDGFYSVSNIQVYIEYIIKNTKH